DGTAAGWCWVVSATSRLCPAPVPGFEQVPAPPLKLLSIYPVTGEFLSNIRVHGLGIGDIQFTLRDSPAALFGEATPVQRGRQSRIDLQGRVEIGNRILGLSALQVDEAAAVEGIDEVRP